MTDKTLDSLFCAGFGVLAMILGGATVYASTSLEFWMLGGSTVFFVFCFLVLLYNALTG